MQIYVLANVWPSWSVRAEKVNDEKYRLDADNCVRGVQIENRRPVENKFDHIVG